MNSTLTNKHLKIIAKISWDMFPILNSIDPALFDCIDSIINVGVIFYYDNIIPKYDKEKSKFETFLNKSLRYLFLNLINTIKLNKIDEVSIEELESSIAKEFNTFNIDREISSAFVKDNIDKILSKEFEEYWKELDKKYQTKIPNVVDIRIFLGLTRLEYHKLRRKVRKEIL